VTSTKLAEILAFAACTLAFAAAAVRAARGEPLSLSLVGAGLLLAAYGAYLRRRGRAP
jgi:hypothetical protein